jgi:HPt (histidine-containing phosphotransfer) domain-containing protein
MDGTRTETPQAPLIDQTMIDGLRAALGPSTEALLAKASGIVEERMARLAALAVEPGDDLARLAHEIGGVSAQVGLKRLSAEALELERMAREGDAAAIRLAAPALIETARETMDALAEADATG